MREIRRKINQAVDLKHKAISILAQTVDIMLDRCRQRDEEEVLDTISLWDSDQISTLEAIQLLRTIQRAAAERDAAEKEPK